MNQRHHFDWYTTFDPPKVNPNPLRLKQGGGGVELGWGQNLTLEFPPRQGAGDGAKLCIDRLCEVMSELSIACYPPTKPELLTTLYTQ